MNKTNDPYYIAIMGGTQLNIRTFEGQRFLRNIIRMPGSRAICKIQYRGVLKQLEYLTVNDWCFMLDYIEEHQE